MPTKIKQSETQKIPKLRFAGFLDDWEEKRLGEVFDIQAGGDIEKNHVSKLKTDKFKYPIYANSDKNKGLYGYSDIYKIDDECVTVTGRGNLGVAVARFEKFYPIVRLLILKSKEKSDIKFFEYCINQIKFFVESTGVPQLTRPQISIYKLNLPSLPEQQKIAEFLGMVDKWIENLRAQKENLEDYKKGMMQKIFSQEVCFRDDAGNDFGEWEEKRLGKVCKKESSGISANSLDDNYGKYKIYGANGKLKKVDFYQQNESYISIVKDGAGVGRILICEPKTSVLGTLDVIKPKKYVNLYFLHSLLSRIKFKKYTTGSTIPHIYFKDYKKEKIQIPNMKEQQKIANFLTSIDNLINSKQQQITQAEKWKKGLMQGLFV